MRKIPRAARPSVMSSFGIRVSGCLGRLLPDLRDSRGNGIVILDGCARDDRESPGRMVAMEVLHDTA